MKKSLFVAQPLTNRAARRAHLRAAHAEQVKIATVDRLQNEQGEAHTNVLKAWSRVGGTSIEAVALALRNYEGTVGALEALLGPDAECYEVDCDLWSNYADWFKGENGFRPRHHVTRAEALAEWRKDAKPFTVGQAEKYEHFPAPILRPDGRAALKRMPLDEVLKEWMGCIAA